MNWWKSIQAHPWITLVSILCTVGGALLTWAADLDGFSPLRSLTAGAISGAGIAYMVVASRTLGAFGEDDEPSSSTSERPTTEGTHPQG